MARKKTVTLRIDVDADRLARVACGYTGETKPELVSRLVREHCPAIIAAGQAALGLPPAPAEPPPNPPDPPRGRRRRPK